MGFWVLGLGLGVLGFGFRALGLGFKALGLEFWIWVYKAYHQQKFTREFLTTLCNTGPNLDMFGSRDPGEHQSGPVLIGYRRRRFIPQLSRSSGF